MTSPPTPPGYMVGLKTMLIEALQQTFDAEYPEPDFRDLWISMEYPIEEHNFPSIWIDYEDVQDLISAGIGHVEFVDEASDGSVRMAKRWRYGGYATFTIIAMTSLERDRLTDLLVSLIAFGEENPATAQFRQYIVNNEFIACGFDWDRVKITASAANQGTPWGSDDMLYERTLALTCYGEFVSDGTTTRLIPLSQVKTYPIGPLDTDPTDPRLGQWV